MTLTIKLIVALLTIAFALGGTAGWFIHPTKVVTGLPTLTTPAGRDTIYVYKPVEVVKWRIKAVHDTLHACPTIITKTDTFYVNNLEWSAYFDTTLTVKGINYGTVAVNYYFPPFDVFDLKYDPPTMLPVALADLPKPYPSKWTWAYAAGGLVLGGLIGHVAK
jgi:hypothetical protein